LVNNIVSVCSGGAGIGKRAEGAEAEHQTDRGEYFPRGAGEVVGPGVGRVIRDLFAA
jgi:hypothetical protein